MKSIETEIRIPDNAARRFETCRKAGLKPDDLKDILNLKDDYGKGAEHIYSLWLGEKDFNKKMVLELLESDVSEWFYERMPNTPVADAAKQMKVPVRRLAELRMKSGGSFHYGDTEELLRDFWQHYGNRLGIVEDTGKGMMTRTETISRLCQLVAEIEEVRDETKSAWFVHGELQKVGAKVQGILQRIQQEEGGGR